MLKYKRFFHSHDSLFSFRNAWFKFDCEWWSPLGVIVEATAAAAHGYHGVGFLGKWCPAAANTEVDIKVEDDIGNWWDESIMEEEKEIASRDEGQKRIWFSVKLSKVFDY